VAPRPDRRGRNCSAGPQDHRQRYITLGSKGLKQLGLKKNLRKLGYLKGFYLGPFGKPAVAALKRFQRDHKLVADGVAGPLTLEAIKAALRRKGKR
jgi:peptidoglycan hydrolase-like protein with peptidoglycan-binding domain